LLCVCLCCLLPCACSNTMFGQSRRANFFWKLQCVLGVHEKFGPLFSSNELINFSLTCGDLDIRAFIEMAVLLQTLQARTGIVLTAACNRRFAERPTAFFVETPFSMEDFVCIKPTDKRIWWATSQLEATAESALALEAALPLEVAPDDRSSDNAALKQSAADPTARVRLLHDRLLKMYADKKDKSKPKAVAADAKDQKGAGDSKAAAAAPVTPSAAPSAAADEKKGVAPPAAGPAAASALAGAVSSSGRLSNALLSSHLRVAAAAVARAIAERHRRSGLRAWTEFDALALRWRLKERERAKQPVGGPAAAADAKAAAPATPAPPGGPAPAPAAEAVAPSPSAPYVSLALKHMAVLERADWFVRMADNELRVGLYWLRVQCLRACALERLELALAGRTGAAAVVEGDDPSVDLMQLLNKLKRDIGEAMSICANYYGDPSK
jgi:hypothetical protein